MEQAVAKFGNLAALSGVARIYLVGARASGKTTVGRLLAAALGYGFSDLDRCLALREGRTIAEIVAESGWDEFRRIENEVLRSESAAARVVLSTGGGVVLSPANRAFMKAAGVVVWLKAPAQVLVDRLLRNPCAAQRPSLTGGDLAAEVSEILTQREPLYSSCSSYMVDASLEAEEVCALIAARLGLNV